MNEDPPSLAAVPRAAAVAGVVFALLFGAALLMVRMSIPGSIAERGGWLADPAGTLRLATHLLAWGGIAFLWFIGVVRTHIGAREHRFLASVYFGSGVLFLGMCFVAAAGTQALLAAHAQYGERFFDSGTFSFMQIASDTGLDPALMHRVAVIASGTLDSLPHNGAVVTMLAVCGCTHRESYLDIVMAAIVSALVALVAVIVLGTAFGSF